MKSQIKHQFVSALRSGDYQQGQQRLKNHDEEFCVLGVLCDLAVKAGVVKWEDWGSGFGFKGELYLIPTEVAVWAGLNSLNGSLPHRAETLHIDHHTLSSMNDSGWDFKEIADLVEMIGEAI
jgi:hypothetical protein